MAEKILNLLIWHKSGFSQKKIGAGCLRIHINNDMFFAITLLPALRQLQGPTPSAPTLSPKQWKLNVDVESLDPVSTRLPMTKFTENNYGPIL